MSKITTNNIVLIGFMGSGKSTVGQALALKLGWSFVDTDGLIETNEGREIRKIFEDDGEIYFRKLESSTIRQVLDSSKQVISTGGGLPCFNDNLKLINDKATTIYLKAGKSLILKRTINDITRPLLIGSDREKTIRELLQKRRVHYEQAQFTFMAYRPVDHIVDDILDLFSV